MSVPTLRGYITQDAFRVAPELIGLPLASASRRAMAMLLDLTLVAVLVGVGGGALFGLAAAGLFFRVASGRLGSRLPGLARGGLRFGGALVLFIVVSNSWDGLDTDEAAPEKRTAPVAATASVGGGLSALRSTGAVVAAVAALDEADSRDEAREGVDRTVKALRGAGLSDEQIAQALKGSAEGDNRWVRQAAREVLGSLGVKVDTARELRPDSLARAWATAVGANDSTRAAALRPGLAAAVAADTLAAMGTRIEELTERRDELQQELTAAEQRAERAEKAGLTAMLTRVADEMGLGFGWTGLYFTAFLAFWKGQTPGKRLMGIRVMRLDGKPMTLWASFERFGGYAASLFTGLLGFVQIAWDRNRQGMHDKIVETVVVRQVRGLEALIAQGGPGATPPPDRRAPVPAA